MTERSFYLGDSFAAFHPAQGAGCAVLLCPPFGWDDITSYRSRRTWAERLAERGHPTLRFDLPATGDSAGSNRVGAWVDRVSTAAEWLRAASSRGRTAAIGIGLGGLLALRAAAAGAAIDDLVLWAVPADGRRLLRELRAFAQIEAESIVAAGAPEFPPGQPLAPGGFVIDEELQAGLESLTREALVLPKDEDRRVLVLGRDGVPPDAALVTQLEGSAAVATGVGGGYVAMTAPPDLARPPLATFAEVDAWLAAADRVETAGGAPETQTLELEVDGVAIRETPLRIAAGDQELFGVLGEPLADAPSGTALALLNAGAIRRIGPNRMWVDIARRWTARGVTTLRLDVEGIGDATGDGLRYTDVSELYAAGFVPQVQSALDELAERCGAERFALLGLCSGAFWGFHTALADERVAAAVMLNPRVLHWHPRLDSSRDARKLTERVGTARFWRRVPTYLPKVVPFARWLLWGALRPLDRPVATTLAQIVRSFDRLRERGQEATLIFCDGEPLRDELEEGGLVADDARWPNVTIELVPGRDHTFRPVWMHPSVHEAVDRALERAIPPKGVNRPAVFPEV